MNISSGPMIQFCTRESARIFLLAKTLGSSSYLTLASGGYIINIKPMAIGILVVPELNELIKDSEEGKK